VRLLLHVLRHAGVVGEDVRREQSGIPGGGGFPGARASQSPGPGPLPHPYEHPKSTQSEKPTRAKPPSLFVRESRTTCHLGVGASVFRLCGVGSVERERGVWVLAGGPPSGGKVLGICSSGF